MKTKINYKIVFSPHFFIRKRERNKHFTKNNIAKIFENDNFWKKPWKLGREIAITNFWNIVYKEIDEKEQRILFTIY